MVSKKINILAIDDNLDNLISIKALINDAFPEVDILTASSGQQGLDLAVSKDPDVILLDVIMPEMDGFDVCRKLKADPVLRDIPVIFVTAMKGDKESRILALECGAEAFLAKPIDESELTAQIRAMLKIKAANMQKRNENERLAALVEEKTSDLNKENEARKLAQEESKEAALRFYSLFDHLSSGVAIYKVQNDGKSGKDYIIVDFNKAALVMEGKAKEEVVGKSLFDLRPNIDQFGLIPIFQKVWQTGESAYFPSKVYVDENYDNWYENRVYKIPSGEIVAIYNDITAKMKIESELAESRILMESIINNTTDAIYVKNTAGEYLLFNHGAEIITGVSAAEILGKDDHSLFSEKEARVLMDFDRKAIENRAVISFEETLTDNLGNHKALLITKGPIYDKEQKTIGVFGIARDITGRKQVEQELRKSEQRFRVAQDISPDGFTILHPVRNETGEIIDFIFVYENQAIARINQTEPQKVIGKRLLDLFPAHRGTPVYEAYVNVANTGNSQIVEDVNAGDVLSSPIWLRLVIVSMNEDIAILAQDITVRKNIEYEIKQSEERFQLLFNQAPLGYQSLDSEGRFLEVNQQWLDTLGYSKDEVIGKWFGDFLCPEYVDGFRQRFPIFKSQGQIHSEFEMQSKDGRRLFIAFEGKIGYSDDGTFKQTHCILQDITNQKKTEKALAETKESYRYLFEYSGVGIGYYTPDGIVISYNQIALKNMGGKIEDFVGKPINAIFPKAEADKFLSRIKKAASIDQPQDYEDYLLLNDGPKWYASTFARVLNLDKKIIGVQITTMDITDRKRAEALQKESEEIASEAKTFLQAAFDNSQAGIAIAAAPDGKLRYVNKAGLLIRGQSEEKLIQNVDVHNYVASWNILHLDGTPYKEDEVPLARAVLYGETCSEEFIIQRDNHEDRIVLANAAPIKDSDNKIKAGIVVFLDITERKKSELAFKESEKLFRTSFENATIGGAMVAKDGTFVEVNDKACEIWGYTREELLQLKFIKITYEEDIAVSVALITKLLHGESDSAVLEKRYIKKDGSIIWGLVSVSAMRDENNEFKYFLVYIQNITEMKETEKNLKYLSYHDQLTNLYNRRFFEEEIERLDTKSNLPISIIMCDINGLKLINDSFGHNFGDELLIKAAETIKKACREGDIVSRIGGDEFVIILPKADAEETVQIANRIKEFASNVGIAKIELSISFGYDTKKTDEQSMLEILANAENHMYRHKLYERSSMRSKTVDLIMNTLFEKSNRESKHSARVSNICQAIASKMDFDKVDVNKMKIAGLVHDIGKMGIDEKILNKAGKLDDYEWEQIKRHPEVGWRILSSANEFSELAQYILNHHERWDGGGYPNGLKGEKIPLEARIITVADAYDAMTGERTYKNAFSKEEAVNELKRCSGTQFDPEIVDIFVNKVLPYDNNLRRGGGE